MGGWIGTVVRRLEEAHRAREAGPAWDGSAACTALLELLHADHAVAQPDEFADWKDLAAVFGLEDDDVAVLQVAAAAELDANVAAVLGLLRGLTHPSRATVGLALELAGVGTATPAAPARLGPGAPLRRHRLLEVRGDERWLARPLAVPDPVLGVLGGGRRLDPSLDVLRTVAVPCELPGSADLAAAIELSVPLAWVRCAPGTAGVAMAAGALRSIGLDWVALDLGHRPGTGDWTEVMVRATREAGLRGRALVVAGADAVPAAEAPAAFGVLADAVVPVVAVGDRSWDPGWLPTVPYLAEAAPLPADERERLWRSGLGGLADDDPELLGTLLGLRLTPEAVRRVTAHAHLLADAAEEPLAAGHVRQSARRVSGTGGAGSNVRSGGGGTEPGLGDLILPPNASMALRELVSWARVRDQVTARGPLRAKGSGIAALFAGRPGTGKTLAANVIAEELSIDLFQVDLSAIVDKYIGETEKNLEKVFQSAEALDVVLVLRRGRRAVRQPVGGARLA